MKQYRFADGVVVPESIGIANIQGQVKIKIGAEPSADLMLWSIKNFVENWEQSLRGILTKTDKKLIFDSFY